MTTENNDQVVETNVLPETQLNDIADMLDGFVPQAATTETTNTEGGAVVDEQSQEAAKGQERVEEKAVEQKPADIKSEEEKVVATQVADVTQVQATPAPVVAPAQSTPDEVLAQIKKENEELKAYISEVAGQAMAPKPTVPLTPEQQQAEQQRQAQAAKQVLNFLPDEATFDEVMKNSTNFNALLTSVVNTAVQRSLQLVPHVATQIVGQQYTMLEAANSFYKDNVDLVPHKKYVGFVTNEVASKHPDWDVPKVLDEVEKEVRGRLKLVRGVGSAETQVVVNPQTGQTSRTVSSNPGFVPGGGGGRRGSGSADANLTAEQKDIISLIS